MAFEIITLNLIPDGEMPVFHASQFDTARPVIIDLVMGEDAYVVPEGITLELHCRKVDDTIVTMEPDEVSENRVTFVTTEQLTACIGDNLCEVALLNGDDHIGTLNFILHVEPDPLAGGLTSESDIYNLTQQIEDIAEEVIGEDYYDKTEVDALLADKADVSDLPDMTDYYTKTATDALLSAKADTADLATVATTGDYDDLINKPAIPAAQIQSDYAQADNTQVDYIKNKPDISGMIATAIYDILPVGTASGAIASFTTEIAGNLTALKCNMLASGGGGTPDNPNPIVGFTECNITNEDGEGNVIDEITIDLGGTRYGGYVDVNNGKLVVTWGSVDLGSLGYFYWTDYLCFVAGLDKKFGTKNIICDSYATLQNGSYESLSNYEIVGNDGNAAIYVKNLNYTDETAFKNAMSGIILAYELATPIEIDISPEHLYANVGHNNVFHDCNGQTEVKYKDTIQHYIDTRL